MTTTTTIRAHLNLDATEFTSLTLDELATRARDAIQAAYPHARVEIRTHDSTGYTPATSVQFVEDGEEVWSRDEQQILDTVEHVVNMVCQQAAEASPRESAES